jgi:nitrogen-specific signal transduction histidine kinase
LRIGIWDNGPGVPSTIRDTAFEPFVSFGKAEGSGLGLAIAKKIVEDHGGEIYLDERNKSGTMFRIKIPFGIPEGAIMPVNPTHAKHESRRIVCGVNVP